MRFKVIIFMVLIVLFTIFVVQNTEPVNMLVFFWQIENLPKIVLLTITLALGIILGIIISTLINKQKKSKKKETKPENYITQNKEQKL